MPKWAHSEQSKKRKEDFIARAQKFGDDNGAWGSGYKRRLTPRAPKKSAEAEENIEGDIGTSIDDDVEDETFVDYAYEFRQCRRLVMVVEVISGVLG